ncbi:hypothetical protein BC936DRAFT_142244 [Jimgerdemannia flammicorona]|uniref:Uncharacterized protein n=1 Tax=Jimgerdemannia flammicorona TaxID=994334 RepID=A0A433DFE6_9FUNG|nr:hypothetical protein BC936DRAFT_142244 [Jimgerdemannia flammicorona]
MDKMAIATTAANFANSTKMSSFLTLQLWMYDNGHLIKVKHVLDIAGTEIRHRGHQPAVVADRQQLHLHPDLVLITTSEVATTPRSNFSSTLRNAWGFLFSSLASARQRWVQRSWPQGGGGVRDDRGRQSPFLPRRASCRASRKSKPQFNSTIYYFIILSWPDPEPNCFPAQKVVTVKHYGHGIFPQDNFFKSTAQTRDRRGVILPDEPLKPYRMLLALSSARGGDKRTVPPCGWLATTPSNDDAWTGIDPFAQHARWCWVQYV